MMRFAFYYSNQLNLARMELWLSILLWVITGYVLASLVMYFIQDFFFFHPEKLHRDFVYKYNVPFREVNIEGVGQSNINALLFHVDQPKGVIYYFKGNTRSNKGWAKFAKDFTEKGYDFFMIDYPGFGKSTGKRNEETIHKNAQIAYLWLSDRYNENQISIYGRSLGSGFATRVAGWNNPAVLILDGPFYSFIGLCRYYTQILPLPLILKYRIPLNKYLQEVKCPVYSIHGDKDWLIPYRFSVRLAKEFPEKLELITIKGAKHNNLPKFDEYHLALNRILNEAIKREKGEEEE